MSKRRSRHQADWRSITDDKEKYQAYLCSREWSEKREAVRKRSNGTCERCRIFPMDACHHLTYARKYHEELSDLQAICNPCHNFVHGKSDCDPSEFWCIGQYLMDCVRTGRRPISSMEAHEAVSFLKPEYKAVVIAIDNLHLLQASLVTLGDYDEADIIRDRCIDSLDRLLPFNYASHLRRMTFQYRDYVRAQKYYESMCLMLGLDGRTDDSIYRDDDEP